MPDISIETCQNKRIKDNTEEIYIETWKKKMEKRVNINFLYSMKWYYINSIIEY